MGYRSSQLHLAYKFIVTNKTLCLIVSDIDVVNRTKSLIGIRVIFILRRHLAKRCKYISMQYGSPNAPVRYVFNKEPSYHDSQ